MTPKRMPNEGDIISLILAARKLKVARRPRQTEPENPAPTPEARQRMAEYAAQNGFSGPKTFGGGK